MTAVFVIPPEKMPYRAVKRMFNVPHGHNATTHIKHLGKTNVFNGKGLELARFVAPRIQIPATAPIYQPQGLISRPDSVPRVRVKYVTRKRRRCAKAAPTMLK